MFASDLLLYLRSSKPAQMVLLTRKWAARKIKTVKSAALIARKDRESLMDTKDQEPNMKIAQRENAFSPFLRLPAELRNQIYEHVLGGKSICLTSEPGVCIGEIARCLTPPESGYNGGDEEHGTLHLLKVCRQIHAEAHLLIFTLNIFRYSKPVPNLEVWKQQRPESLALITALRLYSNACSNEKMWLEGLKYFPNLKRLEVAVQYVRRRTESQQVELWGSAARDPWEYRIEERAKLASNDRLRVIFYRRWRI